MKFKRADGVEIKSIAIDDLKFIGDEQTGKIKGVFATMGVIDRDNDITEQGAFGNQKVLLSQYNHGSWDSGVSALPIGIGTIHEEGNKAIIDAEFDMADEAAVKTYNKMKYLHGKGYNQEFSYALPDVVQEFKTIDGKMVRILKKIRVPEVSPVIMGAGIDTTLTDIKGRYSVETKTASLYGPGYSHARSLIKAGKIDKGDSWSFTAADEDKILGNDKDWATFMLWHLGVHKDATANTKDRAAYPYGKNGKVYRAAIIAIKQRAGGQNDSAILNAATKLLDLIDENKETNDTEGGGKTFAQEFENLDVAIKSFEKRCLSIFSLRESEGKKGLSESGRQKVLQIHEDLKTLLGSFNSLLEHENEIELLAAQFEHTRNKINSMKEL